MILLRSIFRNHHIYLLAILAIGTMLRFLRLDYQSLWFDELASVVPVNPGNSLESVIEHARHDQPPLFFLLLHGWFKIFPYTPYSGRIFTALIGIAGIAAMYLLGKEVKNKNVAMGASGLTAINFFHIYYSQELRFYSLLFLLAVLSYLFFIRCIKQPAVINYAGYSFFTIALLYTHYYGMVILATQAITFLCLMLFFNKRDKNFIILSVASGVIILLFFSPWLPVIFSDHQIQSFWIKKPDPFFPFLYLYNYYGKEPVAFIAGIILTGLTFRYNFHLRKQHAIDKQANEQYIIWFVLAAWLLISLLIPYLYSVIKIPMLHERYTLITLPSVLLLTAIGWDLLTNKALKTFIVIAILLAVSINLAFINPYYTSYHKTQLRELAMQLKDYDANQTKIYSHQPWYFNFYFEQLHSLNKVTDISSVNFEKDLAGINKVWIIQVPPLTITEDLSDLSKNFTSSRSISYGDLQATLYERNQ